MWLREIKRFSRSKSRIVGSLMQPLLFLVSFGYGFGAVFAAAGQGSYINFLAPGIIGMSIIFTSIFNGMQVIWDRQFGFLKETLVAPVPRIAIMFGRTLGGATVATLQGCIVLLMTLDCRLPSRFVGAGCAGDTHHAFYRDALFGARHDGRLAHARHAGLPAGDELYGYAAVLSLRRALPAHLGAASLAVDSGGRPALLRHRRDAHTCLSTAPTTVCRST